MKNQSSLYSFLTIQADTALINGQRLGEWCGHGPVLEQDIAMTNIALDCIGRARLIYQYACTIDSRFKDEDEMAYMRNVMEYKNLLLAEQPNGHFGVTIARQFFLDAFHLPFYEALCESKDEKLAAIAAKSVKELAYHYRWSSEWVVRLGDGTPESHARMQEGIDEMFAFTGEMFEATEDESILTEGGIIPALELIKQNWQTRVSQTLQHATLIEPKAGWMQSGGKKGVHFEHLGHILSELQYMQRVYPGLEW